jgi:MoaA/NifB/PqqE/SkfB family radical SAM enzyme
MLSESKFKDPQLTANGDKRASVALDALRTFWINTGTLCNLTCGNCYIESSPRNDRLAYLSAAEAGAFLDEIARDRLPTSLIGFTGGEPFMNPAIIPMLADVLDRGLDALVLTNAMTPMRHHRAALLELRARHGNRLRLRVSLDHYTAAEHEAERGAGSWKPTIAADVSERGATRMDDKTSDASMEKRKKDGYF